MFQTSERSIVRAGAFALILFLLTPMVDSTASADQPGRASATTISSAQKTNGISVEGDHLTLDGERFLVKGVELICTLDPRQSGRRNVFVENACPHFGKPLLEKAKAWGVNTIVFSVSQAGLDPQAPVYSQAYVSQVKNAFALARNMGFVVIAHVRDHGGIGARFGSESNAEGMPDSSTLRADETLGSIFGDDQGVIIEVYTEPQLLPNSANWLLWRNGGQGTLGEVVGMQTIISGLRAAGVRNVLAIDGLLYGRSFNGAPPLTDPLNRFFYAVHPYVNGGFNNPSIWQSSFGYLVDEGKTVVATEWTEPTSHTSASGLYSPLGRWCLTQPISLPQELLNYLARKRIGVVGFAFDVPGTIVTDFNGTPTSYIGAKCGDSFGGSGEILQEQFKIPAGKF
jgi:hypothetical protein